jgi:nitrogen fixation protein NifX
MTLQRRLQLIGCSTEARWMATSLKVAFATSDLQRVDQHFGAAQSFAIYAVGPDKSCFVEAVEFCALAMDGNEDKLGAKIESLKDCSAVYSQAVGASAIRQLKSSGIQPVKVAPGADIHELLVSLQDELRQGPGSWLAKAIAGSLPPDPDRFDRMEEQGWEE